MATAIYFAPPAIDEPYTLFVTRPGESFRWLLVNRWLADNHPPLFYALAWATNWLGPELAARRLVNLMVFAFAAAALIGLIRTWPRGRGTLVLYCLGLASLFPAVDRAAELRSYYLGLVATSVAIAFLAYGWSRGFATRKRMTGLVLVLLLCFNIHYVTSLVMGSIMLALLARAALRRDWSNAGRLAVASLIAGVPTLACMAVQFESMQSSPGVLWIPGGLASALYWMAATLAHALLANVVLTACGLGGVVLIAARSRVGGGLDCRLDFILTLAAGCVGALARLLAIHAWRPIVVPQYLFALNPPVLMSLTLGADWLLSRLKLRTSVVIVIGLVAASIAAVGLNLQSSLEGQVGYRPRAPALDTVF
jgi:hypothetical protein